MKKEPTLESLQAAHDEMVARKKEGGVVTHEEVEANRQAMRIARTRMAGEALRAQEFGQVAPQIAAQERREIVLRATRDGGYAQSLTPENGN